MRFYHTLRVGLLLCLCATPAVAERVPGNYRVVKPQSLPIQWEGRVIGQLVLPVGKEVEVLKIDGGVYTCRNAKQTFTLMEDCLEPVVATSVPTPVVPEPALPGGSPSSQPLAEPAAAVAAVPAPAPPPPVSPPALPEWEPVEKYLAEVEAYMGSTALNVRYYQYGKLGRWSGREVRSQVRKWKAQESDDARVKVARALDSAFSTYDRELWTKFEIELRTALEVRKAHPVQGAF